MRIALRAAAAALLGVVPLAAIGTRPLRAQQPVAIDAPPVEAVIPVANLQPANDPQPPAPILSLPETTVVGAPYGVGAPGGVTSGSTIVSAANLGGVPLNQSGSSVTVITAEQIQQRRETNVGDMLRGVVGVNVFQNGGPGQPSSVFIRGATSEQTKVMIDGIWANDPITVGGTFDFSTLSIDNIERIEVIRGPQSTLYGSDAIGGVVNIVTKKGSGPRSSSFQAMGGSFGTAREAGTVSGGTDKYHYSVGASYFQNTGFSAADFRLPGNSEPDAFRNGNISSRVGWTPAERFDVEFIMRYIRSDVQTDYGGGANMDDLNGRASTDQMFTRVQLHYLGQEEIWEHWLSYNTTSQTRDYTSLLNNDPTSSNYLSSTFSHTNSQTRMLDWRQALNLTSWNKLFFGAMYYHEEGVSSTFGTFNGNSGPPPVAFGPSTSGGLITDPAVYFQDQINIGERWFTTVGVRQDNYNLAGTATTYRLSSLYRLPGTETAIRGSVGTGFKAPSIFQLFDTFNGNPNLRPEESTGYDFGFDQPVLDGRVVLSATYFHNTYKNLINFAPALGPFGLYFNSTDAQTAGLEFSSLWRVNDRTTVTGTYTKLNSMQGFSPDNTNFTGGPDPLVSNQRLIRRPDDAASLGVNRRYLNNRANVNLSVIYVGQRDDIGFVTQGATTVRTRVSLDPYVVANLAASYDLTSRVQLFGRIDNLTDTHYEQIYGFSTVPFSGYAGMNVRW